MANCFASPTPKENYHRMKPWTAVFCALGASLVLASCASFTLEHVDFGWPVESVLTVSSTNSIEEVRYGMVANVAPIANAEFEDTTALRGTKLRVLRSAEGFYFITGPRFKHVYVLSAGPSTLSLYTAILVQEQGLRDPALNQRPPYVELVDGPGLRKLLSNNDIVEARK
jgi:hypothetical protein